MALNIIKASDTLTVDNIVVTIYAAPGYRKSSLAQTADAPYTLDFDHGAHRIFGRKDLSKVEHWQDAEGITREFLAPYKTLTIDTAGRAIDQIIAHVAEKHPKRVASGSLDQQGWGMVGVAFKSWLTRMRSYGLDIVLLSHMEEKHSGDEIIERLEISGGSKKEIHKVSDAIGRIVLRNQRHVLLFSPTDTAFGKNPANLPPIELPVDFADSPTFLGDLIGRIKKHLNEQTAEQQEVTAMLNEWREVVGKATTAGAMTKLIAASNKLDDRAKPLGKKMLMAAATDAGFEFDPKAKAFTEGKSSEELGSEDVEAVAV